MKKIIILLSVCILAFSFNIYASEPTVVYENDFEKIKVGGLPDDSWTYNINDKTQNNYTEVTVDPDNSRMLEKELNIHHIACLCREYKNVDHGVGIGKGLPCDGWFEDAIAFWEEQRKK